jgi:hypothetical protein
MSFAPDWLRLREPADHRSRSTGLAKKLQAHFASTNAITVYDLGSGLGSNLRGTYHWLPRRQHWLLVDYDANLLAAARDEIARWADSSSSVQGIIEAEKDGCSLKIEFACRDLVANPAPWGNAAPDLVTAAALFDLVSEAWIERFTSAVAESHAAFYTVLTHDERSSWEPRHAANAAMKTAFESHFGRDKGFGPSVGGDATRLIAEALAAAGYRIDRAQSPWNLGGKDSALIAALAQGWAEAVRETGTVAEKTIQSWIAARTAKGASCVIGHEDLLAIPPKR